MGRIKKSNAICICTITLEQITWLTGKPSNKLNGIILARLPCRSNYNYNYRQALYVYICKWKIHQIRFQFLICSHKFYFLLATIWVFDWKPLQFTNCCHQIFKLDLLQFQTFVNTFPTFGLSKFLTHCQLPLHGWNFVNTT